jgi:hypothetical protein
MPKQRCAIVGTHAHIHTTPTNRASGLESEWGAREIGTQSFSRGGHEIFAQTTYIAPLAPISMAGTGTGGHSGGKLAMPEV